MAFGTKILLGQGFVGARPPAIITINQTPNQPASECAATCARRPAVSRRRPRRAARKK